MIVPGLLLDTADEIYNGLVLLPLLVALAAPRLCGAAGGPFAELGERGEGGVCVGEHSRFE
eukprot:3872266-Rhodomonas_salina.1